MSVEPAGGRTVRTAVAAKPVHIRRRGLMEAPRWIAASPAATPPAPASAASHIITVTNSIGRLNDDTCHGGPKLGITSLSPIQLAGLSDDTIMAPRDSAIAEKAAATSPRDRLSVGAVNAIAGSRSRRLTATPVGVVIPLLFQSCVKVRNDLTRQITAIGTLSGTLILILACQCHESGDHLQMCTSTRCSANVWAP